MMVSSSALNSGAPRRKLAELGKLHNNTAYKEHYILVTLKNIHTHLLWVRSFDLETTLLQPGWEPSYGGIDSYYPPNEENTYQKGNGVAIQLRPQYVWEISQLQCGLFKT